MKGYTRLVAAFLVAIPGTSMAQATDAVAVDPDVHRVVLENDYVRVFDARASKGVAELKRSTANERSHCLGFTTPFDARSSHLRDVPHGPRTTDD